MRTITQTLKEFLQRFKEETPIYWKRVRNIALTLAAMAGAVVAANDAKDLQLSENLIQCLKYAIAIGAALTAMAQNTSVKR